MPVIPSFLTFTRRHWPSLLLLTITLIGCIWVVKKYRNPMQMGVLESGKPMTMESMGAITGYVPVGLDTVQYQNLSSEYSYSGTLVAFNEQEIKARVMGRIIDLPGYPGDKVTAGQLIARLDTAELDAQVKESEAGLTAMLREQTMAKEELNAAIARREAAQAELDMAQAESDYWVKEIKRSEMLYTNGAISKDEHEDATAKYQSALANQRRASMMLKEAEAMIKNKQASLDKSNAQQQMAKANRQMSTIVRDYTRIKAPIAGTISERIVSPGTLVEPGMTLMKIIQNDRLRVQVKIPAALAEQIHKGNNIQIKTAGNRTLTTKVSAVFPSADAESRTVTVEGILANPDHKLHPGESVTIKLFGETREEVLAVPRDAIVRIDSQDTTAVWVYTPDTPTMKTDSMSEENKQSKETYYTCPMHPEIHESMPGKCPKCGMTLVKKTAPPKGSFGNVRQIIVSLGIEAGDWVEVLDGLTEGDIVITRGKENVSEGVRVWPVEWTDNGPAQLPPPPTKSNMESMDSMPASHQHH